MTSEIEQGARNILVRHEIVLTEAESRRLRLAAVMAGYWAPSEYLAALARRPLVGIGRIPIPPRERARRHHQDASVIFPIALVVIGFLWALVFLHGEVSRTVDERMALYRAGLLPPSPTIHRAVPNGEISPLPSSTLRPSAPTITPTGRGSVEPDNTNSGVTHGTIPQIPQAPVHPGNLETSTTGRGGFGPYDMRVGQLSGEATQLSQIKPRLGHVPAGSTIAPEPSAQLQTTVPLDRGVSP